MVHQILSQLIFYSTLGTTLVVSNVNIASYKIKNFPRIWRKNADDFCGSSKKSNFYRFLPQNYCVKNVVKKNCTYSFHFKTPHLVPSLYHECIAIVKSQLNPLQSRNICQAGDQASEGLPTRIILSLISPS